MRLPDRLFLTTRPLLRIFFRHLSSFAIGENSDTAQRPAGCTGGQIFLWYLRLLKSDSFNDQPGFVLLLRNSRFVTTNVAGHRAAALADDDAAVSDAPFAVLCAAAQLLFEASP